MVSNRTTRANEPNGVSSTDTEHLRYPQNTDQLSEDELFDALSSSRRRQVIRLLKEGGADLGTLAEEIASVENDTTVDQLDSQQRKRVYIGLYQVHLDQLEEADIVVRDEQGQHVSPGSAHPEALEALQAVTDAADEEHETQDESDEADEPSLIDRALGRLSGVVA